MQKKEKKIVKGTVISSTGISTLTERVRRSDPFTGEGNCGALDVFTCVTSQWGVLCLIALLGGTLRYSELRRKMNGVSEKMLTKTLHRLVGFGLVHRIEYAVIPPHVEYELTALGQEAARRVASLADWLELQLPLIRAASPKQAGE